MEISLEAEIKLDLLDLEWYGDDLKCTSIGTRMRFGWEMPQYCVEKT